MAAEILHHDENRIKVLGGVTDDANQFVTQLRIDPATGRLKVSATGLTALGSSVENVSGTVNGINTIFTVVNTPVWIEVSGQVMVSQAQDSGNYGYTYSAGTVTFVNAPTQTPHSFYNAIGGSTISNLFSTDTFTSTNNQTVFTTTQAPLFTFSFVVNDQPQSPVNDYVQSGSTFTLNSGIPAGLPVTISYLHA
jgi:hypothetical protein